MPPDPRHLLAVHPGLGLLPAGLPYLLPGDREPSVLAVPIAPASCARGLAIDLSRPALRDRVDGLPWALGVLGEAVGYAVTGAMKSGPDVWLHAAGGCGVTYLARADRRPFVDRCTVLAPWPDLAGLSDDDAVRAVVVAALGPGGVLG